MRPAPRTGVSRPARALVPLTRVRWNCYVAAMRGLSDKVAVVAGGAGGIGTASSVRPRRGGGRGRGRRPRRRRRRGGRHARSPTPAAGRSTSRSTSPTRRRSPALIGVALDDVRRARPPALQRRRARSRHRSGATATSRRCRSTCSTGRSRSTCAATCCARGSRSRTWSSAAAARSCTPRRPPRSSASRSGRRTRSPRAGITALARHVASRWGKDGIRANAVAPGPDHDARRRAPGRWPATCSRRCRSTRLGLPERHRRRGRFLLSDDADVDQRPGPERRRRRHDALSDHPQRTGVSRASV